MDRDVATIGWAEGREQKLDRGQAVSAMGQYLKDLRGTRLLTADQEIELALRIEKGDEEARARMIESNLRLVVKIAKRYVNRGLQFMDLVEEGNVGLIKAVERFKVTKGCRFSTYATWWIRQSIERAITNQVSTVRLPVHVSDDISKLERSAGYILRKRGYPPSDEELAENTSFALEYVKRLQSIRRKAISSMDADLASEAGFTLHDKLKDGTVEDPAEVIDFRKVYSMVVGKLSILTERERRILALRFGIDGEDSMTLKEAGKRTGGIVKERVRQIQEAALEKLRKALEREGIGRSQLN